jgi:hypothetical protein
LAFVFAWRRIGAIDAYEKQGEKLLHLPLAYDLGELCKDSGNTHATPSECWRRNRVSPSPLRYGSEKVDRYSQFHGAIFWRSHWRRATGPTVVLELLAEGEFDENLVKAVVAKGQVIKLLPKYQTLGQRGYWIAIQIDPKTGKRIGVVQPLSNGEVTGY